MTSKYRLQIQSTAAHYQLDPLLLEAQVFEESADRADAFRYEPAFYERYRAGKLNWAPWGPLAACSYGLLQIIYATAVGEGFAGRPEALFDPVTNLLCGAHHLRTLLDRTGGNQDAALAAYNGGLTGNLAPPYRNAAYLARVLAFRDRLTP